LKAKKELMFYNAVIANADKQIDQRKEKGPFDIIGDVHGCFLELHNLLLKLGYSVTETGDENLPYMVSHPAGRKIIFLGDLVDRGPDIIKVLKLAIAVVKSGQALAIPGNHDEKLMRYLMGRKVQVNHGLETSADQLKCEHSGFRKQVKEFLLNLPTYIILDEGNLLVAHAGLREEFQGQTSREIREICLFGESTGEHDESGYSKKAKWVSDYRGKAFVVYGHVPVFECFQANNTIGIDTGCIYGNKLSAFRYPEKEIVSVPALKQYMEPGKAFDVE
jgi:protein phosphatase